MHVWMAAVVGEGEYETRVWEECISSNLGGYF